MVEDLWQVSAAYCMLVENLLLVSISQGVKEDSSILNRLELVSVGGNT